MRHMGTGDARPRTPDLKKLPREVIVKQISKRLPTERNCPGVTEIEYAVREGLGPLPYRSLEDHPLWHVRVANHVLPAVESTIVPQYCIKSAR
jgi:hypothetical protein